MKIDRHRVFKTFMNLLVTTCYFLFSSGSGRALRVFPYMARHTSSKHIFLNWMVLHSCLDRNWSSLYVKSIFQLCRDLHSIRAKINTNESRAYVQYACSQPGSLPASSTLSSSIFTTSFSLWRLNYELKFELNEFNESSPYDG